MEEMYEKMDVEDERHGGQIGSGAADNETEEQKDGTGKATRATKESKKAGELLCECLQVYLEDRADQDLYELHTSQGKEVAKPTRDLFIVKLEGSDLSPELFVLKVVRGIKSSQLTDALLSLPFSQVKSLIGCVAHWASAQVEHMLCSRILFYLLELHHHEIVATKALQPVLEGIQRDLKNGLTKHRDTVGFNSAGLAYLRRELENESVAFFGDAPIDKEGDRNEKRKRITIV